MTREQLKWIAEYPDCDTIEINPMMLAAIEELGFIIAFEVTSPVVEGATVDIAFAPKPKRLNGRLIVENVNQGKTTLTFKRGSKPLAVVTICEEVL